MTASEPPDASQIERWFRLIVEAAPNAMLVVDREQTITLVNGEAERLFGYDRLELVGRPLDLLIPERFRRHHPGHIEVFHGDPRARPLGGGRDLSGLRKDGSEVAIEIGLNAVDTPDGRYTLASIIDISERKRIETTVRASEGRYRTLFEHAPDGIIIADATGAYTDANPAACRMLGYTRDEMIGLHASDTVVHTDVAHIRTASRASGTMPAYDGDWMLRRKDNSVFPADVIVTVTPDGNVLWLIRDVSERNQANEATRTAEDRTRFALQNAGVGIWDLDYATGALQWSETLEAQYGLRPGTFAGTFDAFIALVHPDDRAALAAEIEQAIKTGADFSVEHRALWTDGTVRTLTGVGRVILDKLGTPVHGVGISIDVTERRSLQAQFLQSQKMEAVGRLAGGVAHDFNNLLTAILGYCELLLAECAPGDPRRADLSEIETAGRSAAALTRQLLAFSRKEIAAPVLLDLNEVVADMHGMLRRLIGEDIVVTLRLTPGGAWVTADRGHVEQVVMNLVVNARDAMPGGGRLTIETGNVALDDRYAESHRGVTPGPHASLIVTDSGSGMTAHVQARLFEPFFTTKEPGKGTGLGLATVHGIVTGSGGSVDVYSEIGKGTAFKLYFPRATAADDAVRSPTPHSMAAVGAQTVLVVEDSDPLRKLATRLLQHQGFIVLGAGNADDATRIFEANPSIDVLLTDVVLPGASGPELTTRLLKLRPGLKVVYMSGYTEEAIVQHGVLNAGILLLHKPFTSDTLTQKIREALAQ